MWDPYVVPTPFYKRWWFICLAGLLIVLLGAVVAGGIFWLRLQDEYRAKVATFDMSKLETMEEASTIYDRNNNILGRIFLENRETVPVDELPYAMTLAAVAAEDNRFF